MVGGVFVSTSLMNALILLLILVPNEPMKSSQLHLQLGVGLSAEQMAALTHDIVWLEEVEVNGEKVLAPVVYLAQAEGRLAPNGALIQGRDVKLVSGGDLHNVGTLRARNDLSATADNLFNCNPNRAITYFPPTP
ncbi:hemagglutinin [Pseudomonas aeruginosa PA38182]|nr:hemagglutinin [Pseudomonas aeruginosa PA38182]